MKKVLFYTQDRWAFGSLHHSLIKELYKYNINGSLLDWTQQYTVEEFSLLCKCYDVFVTMPEAVMHLHHVYKVPLEKIIAVAHEQWDLHLAKKNNGVEFFEQIKDYAVISKILVSTSKNIGIKRVPKITPAGIDFNNFFMPVGEKLTRIGYGGETKKLNFFGVDRKRGHLIKEALTHLKDIKLVTHNFYHYMCMPAYYKTLDCVIISSSEEAGGMPAMEAAAAGKLVISTPLGYFEEHGLKGGGVVAPLEEKAFVKKIIQTVQFYQDNPTIYQIKCKQIQQYAKDNYDWNKKIEPWLDLLC